MTETKTPYDARAEENKLTAGLSHAQQIIVADVLQDVQTWRHLGMITRAEAAEALERVAAYLRGAT